MFQNGLKRDAFYKRKKSPFIIGIAGDSGAGKSSYIRVLEDCLGKERIMFIEGDGDHRWERNNTHWEEFTQLNPKANYLYRQAEDIKLLKAGNTVERVDYDHSTGKFTEKKIWILMRICVDIGRYKGIRRVEGIQKRKS